MVGPKRHFLPLILISFAAFIFYTFHQSSLPSSIPEPNPDFTLRTPIRNLNPISHNFTFVIKVLAYNRLESISRCLRSLAAADYLGDRVHLHIYIDHFALADASSVDQKLHDSHRIVEYADGFEWKFGEKVVHYRTSNVGLQAQWLEAWWPSSDDEFAFVVEDDLEVSSLYYEFVKSLIMNFYYNASNYSPSIYGVTLQRARFVPGKHGNKLKLDDKTRLFLYQLVGTWGQILFPKPWKEFRLWYDKNKAKGIKPFLEGMVTTGWYKKMGERIWTPWFIKFIQSRGYFNIYANFLHERALSVSHRDAGVNYGKTAGPDSQLLEERSLDFNILEMQPLSSLKWFDFCFREVHPDAIIRNLLCHFERLNIRNYILMGPPSDSLFDLARRGHPVINVDQFVSSVGLYKLTSQGSSFETIKGILAKAYVIKKCIENKYNTWVMDGSMLVTSDLLLESQDSNDDFCVANNLDLFYAKSSSSSEKIWANDFVSKVVAMADSLARKDSATHGSLSFVYILTKLLEQNGARIKRVDETSFGMKIGSDNVSKSSLGDKKLVYWSTDMGLDSIQKRLEELNLWGIDSDLSCTAVVCHNS
ncbi:Nucleotide-diphospho-sugar transferase [Sesbania bispinosa]|nr:Nucleotide-diphospho-sugar transferase [Sesbania bispinosa]